MLEISSMARRAATRMVPAGLEARTFKPRGVPMSELQTLGLTLDGLEALRLADVEGLYQEEASTRMGVSRATFARVLAVARQTVAAALVEGKALKIGGGSVSLRADAQDSCPIHGGPRRRGRGCRCDTNGETK